MDPIETFNNLPPEQQQEIIKQGLKAVDKLSKGLGKLFGYFFDDKYMKKMADAEAYKEKVLADAKAYEINTIGEAIRNNKDLPIKLSSIDNTLSVDITNTEQLIQRSNLRLQYQQAKKQQNIESVIGKTVLELGDKTVDTTEEIDEDWFIRYFKIVEDISDEDMQNLWARILAGEILKPRTYSLRLLDFLHSTSKEELDRILKMAPFVVLNGFIPQNEIMLKEQGITFEDILFYSEIGILHSNIQIAETCKIDKLERNHMLFYTKEYVCIMNNKKDTPKELKFSVYSVTQLGMELTKLANTPTQKSFFIDITKQWGEKYPDIHFSLYNVLSLQGNQFEFDDDYPLIEVNKE